MKLGEKEHAVRESLFDRPAGIIERAPHNVQRCFSGIFNGANREGRILPHGGLSIGKAECEWDWNETWNALAARGLVDWMLVERPNHPNVGGTTTYFQYIITQRGWEVREDDNEWVRELIDARRADEASNNPTSMKDGEGE